MCFRTSLISGFQKCLFYLCAMSRNTRNRSLKNDVINGYLRFLGYIFAKNRYTNLKFGNLACDMPRHNSTTYCTFWNILKNLDFVKRYIKIPFFNILLIKTISWKIRDRHFKVFLILCLVVLFVCILLKIFIFGDFSNIYQFSTKNGMTLGNLNGYNSKRFRENFPNICVTTSN